MLSVLSMLLLVLYSSTNIQTGNSLFQRVSFQKVTDEWFKGSIKSGANEFTVTAKNDMRMVSINTKVPLTGKKKRSLLN